MTDARVHGVTVGVLGQSVPGTARVHATQAQVLGKEPPSDLQAHGETAAVLGVPPPGLVTGLTATTPYQEMVRLTWQFPTIGIGTSYQVRVNGGTPFDVGAVRTTDVPDLEPGTTYVFEVRTVNVAGVSAWVLVTKTTLKILVPFDATGTWVPPFGVVSVDLLLVGGGGSGGSGTTVGYGGGGGAGGVRWLANCTVTPGEPCQVVVGAGGVGPDINTSTAGLNGASTSFTVTDANVQTALGGGGGGPGNTTDPGLPGASGGGGGGMAGLGGAGIAGQGYAGGKGFTGATGPTRAAGGGGGAGAIGANATSGTVAGDGGAGLDMADHVGILWGAQGWFGGGGGGSKGGTGTTNGLGGKGGGGRGAVTSTTAATPGAAGTGGGGGGGSANDIKGQDGGSGFLVVAYLLPLPGAPQNLSTESFEHEIHLTWKAPSSGSAVTSYEVRIDGGTPLNVGLALTHDFTGLTASTEHLLEVRSLGPEGTSVWMTITAVTTAAPGLPEDVAVALTGTTSQMTWQPPASGGEVAAYEVRLNRAAPLSVGLTLAHEFTELVPGATYEHEVRAVGPGGVSLFVLVEETVPETDFTFVWDPSTDDHGILGYEVALDGVLIGETDAETRWYHVGGLVPGASYSMTVQALDIDGLKSGWSKPLVISTVAQGVLEVLISRSTTWDVAAAVSKTPVLLTRSTTWDTEGSAVPSEPTTLRLYPTGTITGNQGVTTGPVVFQPNNSAANLADDSDATWARAFSTNGTNWSQMQFHLESLPDTISPADVLEIRYGIRYQFNRVSGTSTQRQFAVDLYANDADFATFTTTARYTAGDDGGGAFPDNPLLGPSNTTIYDHIAPMFPRSYMSPEDVAFYRPAYVAALQDNPLVDVAPYVTTGNTRQLTIYNFWVEVDYLA